MIYDGTRLLHEPFLDIRNIVGSGGERGLLSVAFHPRYAENGLFYVNYTNLQGHTVVARYAVQPQNPNRANPSSALIILTINQPFANHNGGQLQFGPDGYLYIGMGDGGSGGDPNNRAQNLLDLLGKMLRIDVDNASPYAIPPSNPYAHVDNARSEIWASGLRNPWRFSFDRATGDLWIADVGQGQWEEILPAREHIGGGIRMGNDGGTQDSPAALPRATCPAGDRDDTRRPPVTGGYVYRERATRAPRPYIYGRLLQRKELAASRNARHRPSRRSSCTVHIALRRRERVGDMYVGGSRRHAVPHRRHTALSGRRAPWKVAAGSSSNCHDASSVRQRLGTSTVSRAATNQFPTTWRLRATPCGAATAPVSGEMEAIGRECCSSATRELSRRQTDRIAL